MAGTNKAEEILGGGPAVVLVRPQLGENIGMAARAMLNCGLDELRLVAPRDGWPSETALAAASGASRVIENAKLFQDLDAALADMTRVFATTARPRGLVADILTPRAAVAEMRAAEAVGERVGILFGAERTGLINDEIVRADTVIQVPLNPGFASLNLAQAVLIVGYEWFQAARETPQRQFESNDAPPATKAEFDNFITRLEQNLDETGFLFPPEKRPSMLRNLRALFQRAHMTEQEVRTLHGVVAALRFGKPRRQG